MIKDSDEARQLNISKVGTIYFTDLGVLMPLETDLMSETNLK